MPRDQHAENADQKECERDHGLKQDAGACRVCLPAVEQPVLLGLERRKQAEDFLHQPEALVVLDNGERRLGVAGVALLDGGA